jgi:hypothetical protein
MQGNSKNIPRHRNTPTKEEIEKFWREKINIGKRSNIRKKPTRSKTNANKSNCGIELSI